MQTFRITDYGAVPGGKDCTRAIQKAIDACFLAGGGTVEIPSGEYLTGGLRIRSNMTLLLKSGAKLIASRDMSDYMAFRKDEIEPLSEEMLRDYHWVQGFTEEELRFTRVGSRWNSAVIRAINARNFKIIGEEGSVIDGRDCFDPHGEELYRGPHAIDLYYCEDAYLSGYTIINSANWAHAVFESERITVDGVKVFAGHDGVHFTTCNDITVRNCEFYTGDDCVAGFDIINMLVENCLMNTACSAMRLGGTHITVRGCRAFAPGKYVFRGSLNEEEKRSGKLAEFNPSHRYNMLSLFTYYAYAMAKIREMPGDILIENCVVENADRFVHYNFSGSEWWQRDMPMKSISFKNVTATGVKLPLNLYGDETVKLVCEIDGCDITYAESETPVPCINLANAESLTIKNTVFKNSAEAPLIRRWTKDGAVLIENVSAGNQTIEEADVPFVTQAI